MFCRHVFGNFSGGFCGISRFLGNFAEIPEFRGSATARNIRSPDLSIVNFFMNLIHFRVALHQGIVM